MSGMLSLEGSVVMDVKALVLKSCPKMVACLIIQNMKIPATPPHFVTQHQAGESQVMSEISSFISSQAYMLTDYRIIK